MRALQRLQHGVQIARIEWTRSRRQFDRSATLRAILTLGIAGLAVVGGLRAYHVGTAVRQGNTLLPVETLRVAVTAGGVAVLVTFTQRAGRLVNRVDTDHLLTTVTAREVVLGMVLTVSSRTGARLALPAASVAVGFAVGTQRPASALTILGAGAGLFALTATLAVGLRFAIRLVATRSPRFRRYRSALLAVGFFCGLLGWMTLDGSLLGNASVSRWVGALPTAWFVDLGLVGTPWQAGWLYSLSALVVVAVGVPVLLVVTSALATRVWETEPVSATVLHRSKTLVGDGLAERLFAGHVPRPVLTVARKRWLQERRVPRALLMGGYVLLLAPLVGIALLAVGGVLLAPILLAFILATGTGLAFGLNPVATEYQSLPMTLTTVTGEQFVRGSVLSGVAVGTPVTAILTGLLSVGVSPTLLEPAVLCLTGAVLSVCATTVATAIGMQVKYLDLFPIPVPFTSTTMVGEIGRAGFVRMGTLVGAMGVVCSPAVSGSLPEVVEPAATMAGLSPVAVRVGALLVTVCLAVAATAVAYRHAVRSYDQYTLP